MPLLEGPTNPTGEHYEALHTATEPLISRTTAVMYRDTMSYFLPDYKSIMSCTLGTSNSCSLSQIPNDSIFVTPNVTANALDKFIRMLQDATDYSRRRSEFLVFSDLKCKSLTSSKPYPDVYAMFYTKLDKLIEVLEKNKLHTYIFFHNLTNESEFCRNLARMKNKNNLIYISGTSWNETSFAKDVAEKFMEVWDVPNDSGNEYPSDPPAYGAIIGGSVGGAVFLTLIIVGIYIYRRRTQEKKISEFAELHKHSSTKNTINIKLNDKFEVENEDITFNYDVVLGSGVSGKVYKGILTRFDSDTKEFSKRDVAIKMAHVVAKQAVKNDMLREISLMKMLSAHQNIVQLVGCISDTANPVILTEFCERGDLLHILREHQMHYMDDVPCKKVPLCLLLHDIYRIAKNVADAMNYIASKKFVHRDLAARNVFLTFDCVAKVGDFGLCRQYQEALYTQQAGKLPIKYMALESLTEFSFSEKTDVWSFGVLMFEIFTGGDKPYPDITNEDMVVHLQSGNRLELPDDIPCEL
ncbi:unnamed protein product [Bursaphelenchus okinawaensis]|uniref:Protein kinase domain-containing protein n=1 Tax=Bursaphelenchus okinawaensis TaxID=465554 RepID=A0A811KZ56_9BILA|nr:unnamed protein product [Bursaphelenchus okinawaensis]CAG9113291.1 unnamed protein product [Bursaphelenchus okinawaensis]